MKNKKGNIPIVILVIGILLVCILTIASFNISVLKVQKNFDIQIVKEINLVVERAEFYKNIGFSPDEIDSILGIKTDEQGRRYISSEREGISIRYDFP